MFANIGLFAAVLSGDNDLSKHQIEELILTHSGRITAYPSSATFAVIGGRESTDFVTSSESPKCA